MSDNHEILFIAGAPRSGTSLLCNLLDGLNGVLVFPTEHSAIEKSVWNHDRLATYARNEFISQRSEGQQTLLANQTLYEQKQDAISQEFGRSFNLEVNHDDFRDAYLQSLSNTSATLSDILQALAFALSKSNEFAANAYPKAKWLCYKQPFFTELFATRTAKLLPNSKFIHITREPVARYTSAKVRRLKQRNGKRLGPINRLSYVEGHTFIDIASHRLAETNQAALGEDRYQLLAFEELVTAPESTIQSLAEWLSLEVDTGSKIEATRLGKPTDSRSNISNGEGIDSSTTQREGTYQRISSWNERLVHSALLSRFRKEKFKGSSILLLAAYLTPLPGSNLKNYVCQLMGLARWLRGDCEASLSEFIEKAKTGKAGISGAT